MRRNRSASMTVFAALSFMLVSQFLFALLASARNLEFDKVAQINTDCVLESMFAEYSGPLWERYRLLGTSARDSQGDFSLTNREGMLRKLCEENLTDGNHLFRASVVDLEFTKALLMTDYGGKVFCQAVSSYMKNNIAYETAQSVYNRFESVRNAKEAYGDGDSSIDNALDTLKELAEEKESGEAVGTSEPVGPAFYGTSIAEEREPEESQNLLTTIVEIKKKGILSLVLPKDAEISSTEVNLKDVVSHRALAKGSNTEEPQSDWYDQVLLHQYLLHYMSGYTDHKKQEGLAYELEYLIGGKGVDRDNLKTVIHEILAIREALNLASLVVSPSRQAQALSLATLLAGITVNPIIIEAVKYGILAAWAYAESILDVRALLQGERVAVIKSEVDWTSDLDAIPSLLSGWCQAKSSAVGLSYKDYLGILLFFHSSETLAMRSMDVQEVAIRKEKGYESFHMDSLVCEADISIIYQYPPVFASFVWLGGKNQGFFRVMGEGSYSYFHERQV